jgi:hypothetical protein
MVQEPKRKNQMEVKGAKEWMIHGVCKPCGSDQKLKKNYLQLSLGCGELSL